MVEKIIINPEAIRGLGNILDPKTSEDFESYLSIVETDTEIINGQSMIVYNADYSNTVISLVASSNSISVGESVTFSATVTHNDAPLTGASVTFKLANGTVLTTKTTDSNGVATYTRSPPNTGERAVIATYKTKVSNTVTVTINPLTPTLSLSVSSNSIWVGEDVTLTGTLSYNGEPLDGKKLTFKDGASTLGSAYTDDDGVASLIVDNLTVGNHTLTVSKALDNIYASITSTSRTVTVKTDNELMITDIKFKQDGTSFVDYGETGILCYALDDSAQYNGRVYVTTKNGEKVSGLAVKTYLNNTLIDTSYTNTNGYSTMSNFQLNTSGEYELKAVVEDQGIYSGCNKTFDPIVITDSTIEACGVNVFDSLYTDDLQTDNRSNYGSSVPFSGNITNKLIYYSNTHQYLMVWDTGNDWSAFSGRRITALDGVDEATVRIKFQLWVNSSYQQFFICCTDQTPSSTTATYPYCTRVIADGRIQYFTFTDEETIYTHSTTFEQKDFYLEAVKMGTSWTMRLYDKDMQLLADSTKTGLTNMTNPNWYFGTQTRDTLVYIKEIIAYK